MKKSEMGRLFNHMKQWVKEHQITKLAVGFSGGPDSTFLFHVLCDFQDKYKLFQDIKFLHVNYKLRDRDSDLDQTFCEQLAADRGQSLTVYTVTEAERDRLKSGNMQTEARKIRRDFFKTYANQGYWVATAHHRDDLIETMLFRLFRGTHPAVGMPMTVVSYPMFRPLMGISKWQILQYLTRENLPYREDRSNAKLDYTRNKLRLQLIPWIRDVFPGFEDRLIQFFEAIESGMSEKADSEGKQEATSVVLRHETEIADRLFLWLTEQAKKEETGWDPDAIPPRQHLLEVARHLRQSGKGQKKVKLDLTKNRTLVVNQDKLAIVKRAD